MKLVCGITLPLLILLLWQINAAPPGNFGLPQISSVASLLLHMGQQPESGDIPPLLFSLETSLLRTLLGFLLAVLIGLPTGILLGRIKAFRWLLSPLINVMYVISPLAWLPLLIWLIGFDSMAAVLHGQADAWEYPVQNNILPAMLLIIATASIFPIILTTERAAGAVREDLLQTARLYGANWIQQIRLVVLPHAMPEIISGLRLGLGRAWMVIIAAEMYPSTRCGLGYTIWQSQGTMQFDYVIASILLIGLFGMTMNFGLYYLQKKASFWQKASQ